MKKLKKFLIISAVIFTSCQTNSKLNEINQLLNESVVLPISSLEAFYSEGTDTLFITMMDTNRITYDKYMDLIHEYYIFKIRSLTYDVNFFKITTQYSKYPQEAYEKIISSVQANVFVTSLFSDKTHFLKATETIIMNTSSESMISLNVILSSANDAFNGFDFEKTFIELVYYYMVEQSSEPLRLDYYKKMQSFAVWTYFIKGPESAELSIINSCLSICGHHAIQTETKAELELF